VTLLTETGAEVLKITLCFFSLILVLIGCKNDDDKPSNETNFIIPEIPDDEYSHRKDNDLVGVWELIYDSTIPESINYFGSDSGYLFEPFYIISNDNVFRYRDFDYYRITGDTLWIISTERMAGDSYGIFTKYVPSDTIVTRYHLSSSKDTLYFEKIEHPKSRYLPNCFYVGYAEMWGSGWQIYYEDD
jgi:hypothetical protein